MDEDAAQAFPEVRIGPVLHEVGADHLSHQREWSEPAL